LIGVPLPSLIRVLFSVFAYWLIGLKVMAEESFRWVLWLCLDLLAAELLVVLASCRPH